MFKGFQLVLDCKAIIFNFNLKLLSSLLFLSGTHNSASGPNETNTTANDCCEGTSPHYETQSISHGM